MLEVTAQKEADGLARAIPCFLLSMAASFLLCLFVVGAAIRFTLLSPAFFARQAEDAALYDVVEQSVLAELTHIANYTGIPKDVLIGPVQPQIQPLLTSSLLDLPLLLTGKQSAYTQQLEESGLLSAVLSYGQALEAEGAGVFDSAEAKAIVGEICSLITKSIRIINAEQLLQIKLLQPLLRICKHMDAILLACIACAGLLLLAVFFLERKRYKAYFSGICFNAGLLLLIPCIILLVGGFSSKLAISLLELRMLLESLVSGMLAIVLVLSCICLLGSGIFAYCTLRSRRRAAADTGEATK